MECEIVVGHGRCLASDAGLTGLRFVTAAGSCGRVSHVGMKQGGRIMALNLEPKANRLLVVSNRLPVTLRSDEQGGLSALESMGGLATGMRAYLNTMSADSL